MNTQQGTATRTGDASRSAVLAQLLEAANTPTAVAGTTALCVVTGGAATIEALSRLGVVLIVLILVVTLCDIARGWQASLE
ncbi:hypothetical protein MBT42_12655 [Streptomyces sp. MBT42]|uniref:hypothetical protein n=1 Tax=Streptomyces sp. MBT42 TaxID=1488373 RepID=UPI001E391E46|nr:hypothetical protein [Streptomyces sp. MBT42]MCD2464406.1 hypothetical protein [Streptomyces sp. MBT42]